jgi:DNA helicase MCM8
MDFQKMKLQEMDDESTEPGRIPRTVEVELRGDLVDTCVPGDVITVAGQVKTISTEALSGRRAARDGKHQSLYLLYIQANSVANRRAAERAADAELEQVEELIAGGDTIGGGVGGGGGGELSKVEAAGHFHVKHLHAIRTIALDPFNFHLLVASLCPSIVGQELVKAGLLLTLLGGTKRSDPTSARTRVRVRSDPHILLVGDPGLGKSQMLRAAAAAAPRAVYVCGNVVTSTGLTVTLVNDGRCVCMCISYIEQSSPSQPSNLTHTHTHIQGGSGVGGGGVGVE